ncbi:MAG: hypothetical protein IPN42_02645 [Methylococcaceae bacterium]|nr:hypothetical protein [Methylococcaceae bacterium]
MRCLLLIVLLSVAACSSGTSYTRQAHAVDNKPASVHAAHELFVIDSTLKQLDYEYAKANNAVSVNDAEKVYLERFEDDLLKKRKKICEEELKHNKWD